MLQHGTAAVHHLPHYAAQTEYLFAQTGLLSIRLLLLFPLHILGETAAPVKLMLRCYDRLEASGGGGGGGGLVLLPLHVVQVPRHAQSSDGVQLAVIHEAVVSAARHRHPRHQVPVVEEGHVAPHVGHHHTRLRAT